DQLVFDVLQVGVVVPVFRIGVCVAHLVTSARLGVFDPHDMPLSCLSSRTVRTLLVSPAFFFCSFSRRAAHALIAACVPFLWVETTFSGTLSGRLWSA